MNEAAARLGVSLRQTEDTLTRNMLAATAGFVNCVGGVNGDNPRFCGVVKSLLVDLEAYGICYGDRGQASLSCAA